MTVLLQRLTAPAEWLASRFLGAFASPRRILGTTLPLRLALLVAAIGIATLGLTAAARSTSTSRTPWHSQFDTRWIVASVAVLTVLPGLVFLFSKIWLDGRSVRSPEIDRAWTAGLRALELKGIDLADVPLFLVTGVGSDAELRALMRASDRGFEVNHIPDEPAPLQWYASRQAVFLCLTDLSLVGNAAGSLQGRAAPAPMPAPVGHPRSGALSRTISVPGGSPYDSIPFVSPDSPPSASFTARGTMQFGDAGPPGATGMHSTLSVPGHDWDPDEVQASIAHVCRLLKTARRPFVPANGIVSVLPFRVFGAAGAVVEEFQKCVADDLAALRDGLEIRCPVTALVGGMECESGFRELVRRLGRDAVKSHRFGKGNEVWAPPEPELVEAVVRHACGAFEDWTYHLFTQEEGLAKPGNAKLYALLCRMRTEVQEQLTALLSEGYGNEDDPEAMLFSGVYFAATGNEDDRQAFVKSVFHKVVEQDDDISWTETARSRDARYGLWRTIAGTFNIVLLAMLAVLLFFWATNRPVPASVQDWLSRTTAGSWNSSALARSSERYSTSMSPKIDADNCFCTPKELRPIAQGCERSELPWVQHPPRPKNPNGVPHVAGTHGVTLSGYRGKSHRTQGSPLSRATLGCIAQPLWGKELSLPLLTSGQVVLQFVISDAGQADCKMKIANCKLQSEMPGHPCSWAAPRGRRSASLCPTSS